MTKFNALLWEELRAKFKTIHSIFIIQLVAGFLISLWTMTDHVFNDSFWQVDLFLTMSWSSVLGVIAYLILSIRQNNLMLRSKTWNLIPISSAKLFLTNLCSALIGWVYFFFLQVILLWVLTIPLIHLTSSTWMINLPLIGPYLISSSAWINLNTIDYIKILLLVLLTVLFVYSLFALIFITVRTLSNFAASKYQKASKFLSTIVLILIAYYSFMQFLIGISDILRTNFIMQNNLAHSGIDIALLTLMIFNLVFIAIASWELHKFFEVQEDN